MRNRLLPLFVCLLATSPLMAQDAPPDCPTITLTAPYEVTVGDKAKFSVNVTGGDAMVTPTYNWAVSAGAIESGQGTSVIEVDTTEAESMTITATVDVGGYDRRCSTSESWTIDVVSKTDDAPATEPPPAQKPPVR